MRKAMLFTLSLLLFLTSCQSGEKSAKGANEVMLLVRENADLFTRCVQEMEAFGLERVYVAMEAEKPEEDEEKTNVEQTARPRLVSFEKESDDRTEIQNEILQEALEEFGFEVIFFQTASDSRRTVIFSYTREADDGVQNGFYYSYDSLAAGWWGRKAELERKDGRYLQANKNADAWYYTLQIQENFYYFEKKGDLLA